MRITHLTEAGAVQLRTVGIEQVVRGEGRCSWPLPVVDPVYVQRTQRYGLLRPVPVREIASRRYELVAGERDWLAVQRAGKHTLPVVVLEGLDETDVARIRTTAQATDPITEAERVRDRLTAIRHGQSRGAVNALAHELGRSPSWVSHRMQLLELPDTVREVVRVGALSVGHGLTLAVLDDEDAQVRLALAAFEQRWSVRRLERAVREVRDGVAAAAPSGAPERRSPDIERLERRVGGIVGCPVSIDERGGTLTIDYRGSPDVLDGVLERLGATDPDGTWG